MFNSLLSFSAELDSGLTACCCIILLSSSVHCTAGWWRGDVTINSYDNTELSLAQPAKLGSYWSIQILAWLITPHCEQLSGTWSGSKCPANGQQILSSLLRKGVWEAHMTDSKLAPLIVVNAWNILSNTTFDIRNFPRQRQYEKVPEDMYACSVHSQYDR